MTKQYTIRDLVKVFDTTARTLRFYESIGLISSERTGGGHRAYSSEIKARISEILKLRKMRMSLPEVIAYLDCDDPAARLEMLRNLYTSIDEERMKLASVLSTISAELQQSAALVA